MNFSGNAILICKHYERFYPKPYLCPAGIATIGYGTTHYPNGIKVSMRDVPITEQVGSELLLGELQKMADDVNILLTTPVTQNQFDSLVSFAYNVGPDMNKDGIAQGLGDSTLLKLVNQNIMGKNPDWKKQITIQFVKWIWGGEPKKALAGLVARRNTEAFLFTDGIVKYFN